MMRVEPRSCPLKIANREYEFDERMRREFDELQEFQPVLQDLEWTIRHAHMRERVEYLKEFDTRGGNLIVTYEYPPKDEKSRIFTRKVATRASKGIYWAWDLSNDIELYTNWSVEHPFNETHRLYDAITKAPTPEEAEVLRQSLWRMKTTYGDADSLKQIIHHGRAFVNSADPYVLQIRRVDRRDGEPYIGVRKKSDQFVRFQFHRLMKKIAHASVEVRP